MRITVLRKKSNSKYRNKKCVVNGITFDSIKEAKRYSVLLLKENSGEIFKLQLQVSFKLKINSQFLCTYKADFVYYNAAGKRIVEDVKGMKTPVYNLKKKLLFLIEGIEITEI